MKPHTLMSPIPYIHHLIEAPLAPPTLTCMITLKHPSPPPPHLLAPPLTCTITLKSVCPTKQAARSYTFQPSCIKPSRLCTWRLLESSVCGAEAGRGGRRMR